MHPAEHLRLWNRTKKEYLDEEFHPGTSKSKTWIICATCGALISDDDKYKSIHGEWHFKNRSGQPQ